MNIVLVIGCGNTLRGDDAAGVRAVELLAEGRPDIDCLCVQQLVPELAEQLADYAIVIFLDADVTATRLDVRPIAPDEGPDQPWTHFLSPASLLALSRHVYHRVPATAYSIGIPATEFEFSEQLSSSTERAVRDSIGMIEQLIRRSTTHI